MEKTIWDHPIVKIVCEKMDKDIKLAIRKVQEEMEYYINDKLKKLENNSKGITGVIKQEGKIELSQNTTKKKIELSQLKQPKTLSEYDSKHIIPMGKTFVKEKSVLTELKDVLKGRRKD